jgi:hypothetical protein
MHSSYTFTFKPEKQTSFYRIELLVVLLHLVMFIVIAKTNFSKGIGMPGFVIVTALIYLVLFFNSQNKIFRSPLMEVPLFVFIFWWLYAEVYWMAALVLVFAIFAIISKQKVQVIFLDEQIIYKSFPKKIFNWADINNVILKDGLLTIDFKNNKLIQQLLEEDKTDEESFNIFCHEKLQNQVNISVATSNS